jgi:hypothetical protein
MKLINWTNFAEDVWWKSLEVREARFLKISEHMVRGKDISWVKERYPNLHRSIVGGHISQKNLWNVAHGFSPFANTF